MTIYHEAFATQEQEIVELTRMLESGQHTGDEALTMRMQIEDRKDMIRAGIGWAAAKHWTQILTEQLDPLLRVRWDHKLKSYCVDRWAAEPGYWVVVGVIGSTIRTDLLEYLRSRDMQAVGAQEYLKRKREAAAKVAAENERKSTEKVHAAVDSLSEKQVKNFLAVERARHTGETIVHHGADLKFVEHVEKVQKTTPAIPEDMGPHCLNPGLNPKVYKRKTGGKHVSE